LIPKKRRGSFAKEAWLTGTLVFDQGLDLISAVQSRSGGWGERDWAGGGEVRRRRAHRRIAKTRFRLGFWFGFGRGEGERDGELD